MIPREQIGDFCQAFVDGLHAVLEDRLFGVYLYGAVAFPESGPTGDIDFHVVLREALTDGEKSALYDLHESLTRDFPALGGELDGYYILEEDARRESPPKSQMWACATDGAWALHRRHILAGRCIVLSGPDPTKLYPPATWPEVDVALQRELDFVRDHLDEHPDYCVLNLCRLMYSYRTQDVVISKAAAADWAFEKLPHWRRHVEMAKKSYAGQATLLDKEFMRSEVKGLFRFACERIGECRKKEGVNQRIERDQ